MVGFKRWVKNYFGFSRRETNGFIILLPLMMLIIFSEPIYRWIRSHRREDFSKEKVILDSLTAQWERQKKEPTSFVTQKSEVVPSLFAFNPNDATEEELNALGFPGNLASRIIHYRAKGGKFRIKSDMLKIYGMDSVLFHQLIAYIELPEKIEKEKPYADYAKQKSIDKKSFSKFDLNKADTAEFKKIYGIGPVLALRILNYRESLGGFIKPSQVSEVYGLDSAVVNRLVKQSFLDGKFLPKMINMNTATEVELDAHPYISKSIAKAIVAYRFQHGNFNNVTEIRDLKLMTDDMAERIIPYLKVKD